MVVHAIMVGRLRTECPEIFSLHHKNGTPYEFECSERFVREFMREKLGWHDRKGTRPAGKLPDDWETICGNAAIHFSHIIREEDIPIGLILNFDQTGIVFVQGGKNSWAPIGSRQVSIHGEDEKRAFTVVTGMSASGELLPFQAIYKGKGLRSCPKRSADKYQECIDLGIQFTFSGDDNHWATQKTMRELVDNIIAPYLEAKKLTLGLPSQQKSIIYLDCWSVH